MERNQNLISRGQNFGRKYQLFPYSEIYESQVKQYILQTNSQYKSNVIYNIFLHPYSHFTFLDKCLYYTGGDYSKPPVAVLNSCDFFNSILLPLPLPDFVEILFKEFKECLENWLTPYNKKDTNLISSSTSSDLDKQLNNILLLKEPLIKQHSVLIALKDYYIQNGLPGFFNNLFSNTCFLYNLDKNIVTVSSPNINGNPFPTNVRLFTVTEWLHCFNSHAKGYQQSTIVSAYPILCDYLPCFPISHEIFINNDVDYFVLTIKEGQPSLIKTYSIISRSPCFSIYNLMCNRKHTESAKIIMSYLLQQKFTNLSFFHNLITTLYSQYEKPAFFVIRLAANEEINNNYVLQLEQLFDLYDLTDIIKKRKFLPTNISDWYSHLYCAKIKTDTLNAASEDFMLRLLKGKTITSKTKSETFYYKNRMPFIMFVNASHDISYIKFALQRQNIQLHELELTSCSMQVPDVQTPIWEYIRFMLLLGKAIGKNAPKKPNTPSKGYSQSDILKTFVKQFCTIDAKDAEPIMSKAFYNNYIVPYYKQFYIKPIGPTVFNRLLPELFSGQVFCHKHHPKKKVEGQHLFNMVFHEEKWNAYLAEKQNDNAIDQDEFGDKLQVLLNQSSEMIDTMVAQTKKGLFDVQIVPSDF